MSGAKIPFVDLKAQHASIAAEVEAAVGQVMTNADFILGGMSGQLDLPPGRSAHG